MAIIGFACPVCKRDVPTDHYATTDCGLFIPPDYATAVLHDNDARYITGEVTVTAGLGCPRSRALEADIPVHVNPLDYNALLIGRAWDQLLEKHAPVGTAKIQLKGTIAGITIYGEVDRVLQLGGRTIICDHKHGNNFQQKYVRKEGAKREAVVQTSIYAELYEQQFGVRPTHGQIIYHFSGGNSGDGPLTPFLYELLDLGTALNHKPYNGSYTVLDLYQQADSYYRAKKDEYSGVPVRAADLPLAGRTMSFGAREFCSYCQVERTCTLLATGSPF